MINFKFVYIILLIYYFKVINQLFASYMLFHPLHETNFVPFFNIYHSMIIHLQLITFLIRIFILHNCFILFLFFYL